MPVSLKVDVPYVKLTYDKANTKKVMRQAATEVARAARALIRGSTGGGRKYGTHVASAAGSPPASLTGKLAASIRVSVKTARSGTIVARITDTASSGGAFYSRFLETGSIGGGGGKKSKTVGREHKRGGAKGIAQTTRVMEPRPYLTKALEDREASLSERITDAVVNDIQFVKMR